MNTWMPGQAQCTSNKKARFCVTISFGSVFKMLPRRWTGSNSALCFNHLSAGILLDFQPS